MPGKIVEIELSSGLPRLGAAFRQLSFAAQDQILRNVLNRVIDQVYTQVVRALAKTTGVQQSRLREKLRKSGASGHNISAQIYTRGQFTVLKDFDARQTKQGVSAAPWGKRRIFKGTFIGPGGNVFKRVQGSRKIKKLYGFAIPREMLRGESAAAAKDIIATVAPRRLEYETGRAIAMAKATNSV